MKSLAALLSLSLAAAPLSAITMHQGDIITLSEADRAACDAGGGCVFVTQEKLMEAIAEAAKRRAGNCMGVATWKP